MMTKNLFFPLSKSFNPIINPSQPNLSHHRISIVPSWTRKSKFLRKKLSIEGNSCKEFYIFIGCTSRSGQYFVNLDHFIRNNSSILRESEATNARFSEQTGLLKNEIRRLEKNQERKENIHNLEYLKNVVFKFITLQPGTEKTGLIPVLETMLQVRYCLWSHTA